MRRRKSIRILAALLWLGSMHVMLFASLLSGAGDGEDSDSSRPPHRLILAELTEEVEEDRIEVEIDYASHCAFRLPADHFSDRQLLSPSLSLLPNDCESHRSRAPPV